MVHLKKIGFILLGISAYVGSIGVTMAQIGNAEVNIQTSLTANQPVLTVIIEPVRTGQPLAMAYQLTDDAGTVTASDSLLLPSSNTLQYDGAIIHRVVSPNRFKTLRGEVRIWQGTQVLAQRSIVLRASEPALSFALSNRSQPTRLSYVHTGDTLVIESEQTQRLFLYKLNAEFWASAPPMVNATLANNAGMQVDSLLQLQTNQPFILEQSALYFAQTDTSSQLGFGIKVVPADYPKFQKITHVVEPMLYISTQSETKTLRGVREPKPELDKFWLTLGGSPDNARKVIKRYFQRVSYANALFTGYKQGWKTDRGIIYIVFGKPDRVLTTTDQLQWIYGSPSSQQGVVFTFEKKDNQFSGSHYELIRDNRYKTPWKNTIELWRSGLVR